MYKFPRTAHGVTVPASPEEIAKEDNFYPLASDEEEILTTDDGVIILYNCGEMGFTNPNLHRRVDQFSRAPQGSDYSMVHYDENGNAFPQSFVIGVWDGINSYRTTITHTHDEESETCEIP